MMILVALYRATTHKKTSAFAEVCCGFLSFCGEDEIRTRGTLIRYVGLANRWFQPLTHLSVLPFYPKGCANIGRFLELTKFRSKKFAPSDFPAHRTARYARQQPSSPPERRSSVPKQQRYPRSKLAENHSLGIKKIDFYRKTIKKVHLSENLSIFAHTEITNNRVNHLTTELDKQMNHNYYKGGGAPWP